MNLGFVQSKLFQSDDRYICLLFPLCATVAWLPNTELRSVQISRRKAALDLLLVLAEMGIKLLLSGPSKYYLIVPMLGSLLFALVRFNQPWYEGHCRQS